MMNIVASSRHSHGGKPVAEAGSLSPRRYCHKVSEVWPKPEKKKGKTTNQAPPSREEARLAPARGVIPEYRTFYAATIERPLREVADYRA